MRNQKLKQNIQEAFSSVLPVSIIVLVLATIMVPMTLDMVVMFVVGAMFLVVGMGLFSLGTDMSMIPIGESVGSSFTRSKRHWLIAGACFLLGFIVTIAEPDLQVLAEQAPSIHNTVLIMTVAAGAGIFLVFALLRKLFHIKLRTMLYTGYIAVFILSIFTPESFVAVAFDSGGVTTGPVTVPFILSLGIGLASAKSGKDAQDDSFGFLALCSIGPILAVMILGILYNPQNVDYTRVIIPNVNTMRDVLDQFRLQAPRYINEVALALTPIVLFFIAYQVFTRRYTKRQMIKICVGLVYTFAGLVLFLTGVNVGFIPVGNLLGADLAASPYRWLLMPIGALVGYYLVAAEPAIHILNKQVEEITGGTVTRKAMNMCLSIGVAISVVLSMVRVLTGLSLYWFLVPGYAIALVLAFFVPNIFVGIAFDSGGVASGTMTSTFLLPFAMGACEAVGGNVLTDAFGIVAMVAMTPLIAIQLMGYVYQRKLKKAVDLEDSALNEEMDEIVELFTEDGDLRE